MITIKEITKKKRKFYITDPEGNVHMIHPFIKLKYNMKENTSFTEKEWNTIKSENDYQLAEEIIINKLKYSMRSEGYIKNLLKKSGFSHDVIQVVIQKAKSKKWIDDETFLKQMFQTELRKGTSSQRMIQKKMRQKGFNDSDIQSILMELSEDTELDHAMKLAKKKYRLLSKKTPEERKKKIIYSLQYKGFSLRIIQQVMDQLKLEGEE